MNESKAKHLISVIIADDIVKNIDSEISIELDYIIHQHDKMELEKACNDMHQLRHDLLKQVNIFHTIGAISLGKKCYLDEYIREKIGNSIFYIKTIIYESEVNEH